MDTIKNCCFYLILGSITSWFCWVVESDFLSTFLHAQIITICITLVAITSAVRGIVLGKLVELGALHNELDFQPTFKELKISIYEQVTMIIIAILSLIIYASKQLPPNYQFVIRIAIDSILTGILYFNIYILCDTGIAVIDIFKAIHQKDKMDK